MSRTLSRLTCGAITAAILSAAGAHAQLTVPLVSESRLFYVGIEADYPTLGVDDVQRILAEDLQMTPVGASLRSLANAQRRIWAFRAEDPDAATKALARSGKKAGFSAVERLQATVIESGVDPFTSTTARLIESDFENLWASWIGPRGETMWLFHESRLTRRALEKGLEKREVRPTFHHRPFTLSFEGERQPDFAALETIAIQKLDLLRATRLEKGLELEMYLRAVDSLVVIEQGGSLHVCPDFARRLLQGKSEAEGWSVTFYSGGFPFL